MPDDQMTPAQEQQAARQRLQANLLTLLADEIRMTVKRYHGVYGIAIETALWAQYSAMITTMDALPIELQEPAMGRLAMVMDKKHRALAGEPPVPAETHKPDRTLGEEDGS